MTVRGRPRVRGLRAGSRIAAAFMTVVVVVLFGGLLYLQAFPPIVIVMSASMEPAIDTGAIVLMKRVEAPRVGDVVPVPVPAQAQEIGYPEEVLHRVIEITEDGLILTKGDNLDKPDPFAVPASAVNKRVVAVLPGAGQLLAFLFSPYGLLWIAVGIILFVVMPFFDGQRELKQAVSEYGYHLRSHTQILQSMSIASQELAATAERLRESLDAGSVGTAHPASRAPATAVDLGRPPDGMAYFEAEVDEGEVEVVDDVLSEWLDRLADTSRRRLPPEGKPARPPEQLPDTDQD